MKLHRLDFAPSVDEDGDDTVVPVRVHVEMDIEEALWIAEMAGQKLGPPVGSVYDCLVGDVFNRYWEDGTKGARRDAPTVYTTWPQPLEEPF